MWCNYVFHKQTVDELAAIEEKDARTIRAVLSQYEAPPKIHYPRAVHIVVDATYFGDRKEKTDWCIIVARDPHTQEDLAWTFAKRERTFGYTLLREELEGLGYEILSVTGDGFEGIKTAFSGIPYQMCHVHMERLVTRGTTQNPKTEAGQVLLTFIRRLHHTNSHQFHVRFEEYINRYRKFLNERTTHPETGQSDWTHRPLRQAVKSIEKHKKHLFTYEHNKNIVKNTNSLEGHFTHVKQRLGTHRGVPRTRAEKILHSLMLASSVAPSKKKLYEIL